MAPKETEKNAALEALRDVFDEATALSESKDDASVKKSIPLFRKVIDSDANQGEGLKLKEQAIYNLADVFVHLKEAQLLKALLDNIRPFFSTIPKAKTSKMVKALIGKVSSLPDSLELQIDLCKESIAWTIESKRTFLRRTLEGRLAAIYLTAKDYTSSLALIKPLLKEVKRMDDKQLCVEIQLLESRVHHALRNLPRAKASLTAARTNANAFYCPPTLQGQIDLQAGTLHAVEKDYKTSYSYFFEAFESYDALADKTNAMLGLKYMLLCKIMIGEHSDVNQIISGQLGYAGREVEALQAVAKSYKARSLKEFEAALKTYDEELNNDEIIHSHLTELYATLLEQNLCRLIEPFSAVQIAHVATLIELPEKTVEKKLSQMILDKKFGGILDQGNGMLIVFEETRPDHTYPAALETIDHLGHVVDSLYQKAQGLS
eukprot:TRINITY_DN17074_c0_g1_i1.p1 TRINITY_DN17074_c0_g1~~TRINITY_DN17074_c0_g1_i1.p1  ORF type:complete len:453 (+),score=141.82 TRINITY_DN17074_c0_g1_i1:63-1361(+)